MKSRSLIGLVVLCSLFAGWIALIPTSDVPEDRAYPASPTPDRIILTWNGDPATTQAVSWRTDTTVHTAIGQVTPAMDSSDLEEHAESIEGETTAVTFEGFTDHYHTATFNNLSPGTRYAYRVGDGNHWSEWFHFSTAESAPNEFSFIYFGDAQNDIKALWSRTVRAAYSETPDARFLVHAGDLTLSSAGDVAWGEWFEAGSWILATVPSIPATGNSDHFRLDTEHIDQRMLYPQWSANFSLPRNGPEGLQDVTYYIDYQGVRIISLYSNFESMEDGEREILLSEDVVVTHKMVERQTRWLEEVLADNPNQWTVVTFHHPVFSPRAGRDNERLRDAWRPLFNEYAVDLVLQGHDHLYARGRDRSHGDAAVGPVYVISISGPKMREIGEAASWIDRSAENTQLFQVITVSPEELQYRAHTVTGELFDSFTLRKSTTADGSSPFVLHEE